jgi:hypothetical protein
MIVDWVEKGAVTAVKNQGSCGGGALFSTMGGVEGLSKVATGTLQVFSEQQLIDCVFGCSGSQPLSGYNYYKTHGKPSPMQLSALIRSTLPLGKQAPARASLAPSRSMDIRLSTAALIFSQPS